MFRVEGRFNGGWVSRAEYRDYHDAVDAARSLALRVETRVVTEIGELKILFPEGYRPFYEYESR